MFILFSILFFMIFGELIGLAFRATWGIFKIMTYIVFLPRRIYLYCIPNTIDCGINFINS